MTFLSYSEKSEMHLITFLSYSEKSEVPIMIILSYYNILEIDKIKYFVFFQFWNATDVTSRLISKILDTLAVDKNHNKKNNHVC